MPFIKDGVHDKKKQLAVNACGLCRGERDVKTPLSVIPRERLRSSSFGGAAANRARKGPSLEGTWPGTGEGEGGVCRGRGRNPTHPGFLGR